tara:strand:- start:5968 stop:7422 length:1455 start_codon:yes stop_codon:yes gene_type:complete
MNIKYIVLTIILFTISFCLSFQKVNSKELNITDLGIINYIPKNDEITLISNANKFEINRFLKSNIKGDLKEELITLKNGIYSFLGFDFKENFQAIYDGELALSIFNKGNKLQDVLLIIKVKDSTNINDFLNINDNSNEQNKIISFNRPEKINFLKYVTKTNDNYIIFTSNKDLIISSINAQKKGIKSQRINKIPKSILKQIQNDKLFLISNEQIINNTLGENYFSNNQTFITLLKYKNNHLKLRSYSINNIKNINNDIFNFDFFNANNRINIILANYINIINGKTSFLEINNIQSKIIEDIKGQINHKSIFLDDKSLWTLVLKNEKGEDILFDKINIFNGFNRTTKEINNINYSVFSKEGFEYKDNKIFYVKENPIFIKEYNNLIFISNNFSYLFDNDMLVQLAEEYFNNNINSNSNKRFIDDQILIKNNFDSKMINTYPILNKIKLFISNSLNLEVNQFRAQIEQNIPALNPTIFIESELQIL